MHKLLYYPNFEIQDQDFLKFALLYVDEIRPIIPEGATGSLSDSMKDILNYTDLIHPYSPKYEDGNVASFAAMKYLEDKKFFDAYSYGFPNRTLELKNYTLYSGKYTYEFENYCLETGLGKRCNEGILLNEDVAYTYMSILAEIISRETGTDMITDNARYSVPSLRTPNRRGGEARQRLDAIQREIQFYVPSDMRRIPLEKFIKLRSDDKFETVRKRFVQELNLVLDAYEKNPEEVDLNKMMESKQEVYGLMKELFFSCAAVVVGVHFLKDMSLAGDQRLDFWNNAAGAVLSMETLKQHVNEMKRYITRIEGKKQTRKYLTRLKQLRTGIL